MRRLGSARLVLRGPSRADAEFLRTLRATATGAGQDVDAWIALADAAPPDAYGGWVVTLRATGRPIGVLLYGRERPGAEVAELSIEIEPESRGRGYGKEALRRAVRHLTRDIHLPGLSAYIAASNCASARLFTTVGFRPASEEIFVVDGAERKPGRRFAYVARGARP